MKRKVFFLIGFITIAISFFIYSKEFFCGAINADFQNKINCQAETQMQESYNCFESEKTKNIFLQDSLNEQNENQDTITTVELALYWGTSVSNMQYVTPQSNNYYEFPFNAEDVFELRVETSLSATDRVQFFYYKEGNYKYMEIENKENARTIDITNLLKSVGTLKFFAKLNNNLVGENNVYTINITPAPESTVSFDITYEEIIGSSGGMNSYRLILTNNAGNSSGFDIENLTILWYVVDGNNSYLIRSGNYALYTPDQEGRFTIKADALSNGVSIFTSTSQPETEILARSNNSANVLMYVLIVVGVLSVGLAISIIIKVKSEKVW